ncbi:MAG: porin family protein [Flavobacteriia bacterium]|nr:porin family protein [Flavobacteriia bacterium]
MNLRVHLTILACSLGSLTMLAQDISLQAYNGYQFFGRLRTTTGELHLDDSYAFGFGLDFGLNRSIGFNILYTYQGTDLKFEQRGSFGSETITRMNVNYIMAGSSYHLETNSKVTPFGGVLVGLAIFDPANPLYDTETFFAFGGQVGARLALSDRFGINLRTQLLAPVQGLGAGLWCGGGGCDVGLSAVSSILQMNAMLGIDLKLH